MANPSSDDSHPILLLVIKLYISGILSDPLTSLPGPPARTGGTGLAAHSRLNERLNKRKMLNASLCRGLAARWM
jgi:hypothetical protein